MAGLMPSRVSADLVLGIDSMMVMMITAIVRNDEDDGHYDNDRGW